MVGLAVDNEFVIYSKKIEDGGEGVSPQEVFDTMPEEAHQFTKLAM